MLRDNASCDKSPMPSPRSRSKAAVFVLGAAVSILPPSHPAEDLDGLWLSDGYGLLAEIKAGQLQLFEITPLSCIASDTLVLKAEPHDPRGVRFVSSSG